MRSIRLFLCLFLLGAPRGITAGLDFPTREHLLPGTLKNAAQGHDIGLREGPPYTGQAWIRGFPLDATQSIVYLNEDVAVRDAVTIPKDVVLVVQPGGRFSRSGAGTLKVEGTIVAPRVRIFYGFTSSFANGRLTKDLTLSGPQSTFYPEWFGALADYSQLSGSDNSSAVQLMFDSVERPSIFDPHNVVRLGGGVYSFAPGNYYFSNTISIRKQCIIGGAGRESTVLVFAQNKDGFIFHGNQTEIGRYGSPQTSSAGATIRDLEIHSVGGGANTHTVNMAPNLVMTRIAGISFLANDLFGQGRSVTIGASEWPMFGGSLAPPPTASTLPLASKQFMIVVGNAVKSRVYMTNHNGEVESWWVGATVSIAGNIRTITAVNVDRNGQNNNFDLNADLPDGLFPGRANYLGTCLINAIRARSGVAVRLNTFSGIRALVPLVVEHVRVSDFPGEGIDFSSVGQPNTGSEPNTNNSSFTDVQLYRNLGNGLYSWGTNSNNCNVQMVDAQVNHLIGIADYSFLGNNYRSCHTSSNLGGAYATQYAGVNRSTFRDCYAEADQPPIYLGQYGHWDEGNPGCGFARSNQGTVSLTNGATGEIDMSGIRVLTVNGIDPTRWATKMGEETLANKRVRPRVAIIPQSNMPAINTDITDIASISGLAQAVVSMTTNLSGNPSDGEELIVQITDDGTSRNIDWGASFEPSTISLPKSTVAGMKLTIFFMWNASKNKWRCVWAS